MLGRLDGVNARDEDEVWRDIVEHYGDAPSAEELDLPEPTEPPRDVPPAARPGSDEDPDGWHPIPWEDEGRFVPPEPPPVPLAEPKRMVAWIGLFGAPLLLLLALLSGLSLGNWMSTLLIAWFLGGFGYLIATMNDAPRDPGDDGARL